MMNKSVVSVAVLLPGLFALGCAVSERVYLQEASITAPTGHLPIRVAQNVEPGQLTLSPSISIASRVTSNAKISGHSQVNAAGTYAVDTIRKDNGAVDFRPGANPYQFSGTNLHWTTPALSALLSFDYTFSKKVALEGGLCYASSEGSDLWGGHIGLGLISEGDIFAMRLSGGFQWTPVFYDVSTAVETEYSSPFSSSHDVYTTFYRDAGQGAPFGWYVGMTINTRAADWYVQPFVNLTLSKERFFSFEPTNTIILGSNSATSSTDVHSSVEAAAVLVVVSPGLTFSVGPSQRILIGARWAFAPDLVNQDGTTMPSQSWVAPFVQIDFGL